MPRIPFSPPVTEWDGLVLKAHQYWPNHPGKRDDLLRACFPKFLAVQQRHNPDAFASQAFWDLANQTCRTLGGWEAIADAPRYTDLKAEIAQHEAEGTWVGIALTLLQQLHRQGVSRELISLNRIAYLLDEFGQEILHTSVSRDTFLRAWKRFKNSASIWAGYLAGIGWWNQGGPPKRPEDITELALFYETEMLDIYFHAQEFFRFGTTYRAKGSPSPLMDPETTWEVQAEVEGPAFELPAFEPVILDALKAYPWKRPHPVRPLAH